MDRRGQIRIVGTHRNTIIGEGEELIAPAHQHDTVRAVVSHQLRMSRVTFLKSYHNAMSSAFGGTRSHHTHTKVEKRHMIAGILCALGRPSSDTVRIPPNNETRVKICDSWR